MHPDVAELVNQVEKVIVGKTDVLLKILSCWLAEGHVLLEDVPGTGKTMLSRALSQSTNIKFNRVQFTPDLLPSDILGVSIFNQKNSQFEFHEGPIFTALFLGDEINRATPKTQSALLEAMSEGQVSTEGQTHKLNPLFFVMATQNPVEQLGTFELPEAQLDRFMMKLSLGYLAPNEEAILVKSLIKQHPIDTLEAVVSERTILDLRNMAKEIRVSDDVYAYIISIVNNTRTSRYCKIGASPRGTIALVKASQTMSLCLGLDYVRPNIVKSLAPEVLSHRLILTPEAKLSGLHAHDILNEILDSISIPHGD